jgi:hypothetical protein
MKGRIMPRVHASLPSHPPVAPVAISIDGVAAGLALRDKHRFRFFSGHPRFDLLDGSRFSRIEDVRWAVKRLSQASEEQSASPPPVAAQILEPLAV